MNLNTKTLEKLRILINEETEYRSGPKLIEFFNQLGFSDNYQQGFPSRWFFTDEKLKKINNTSDLDKCIRLLLAPINFIGDITRLDQIIIDFNKYLSFDKWNIVRENDKINFKRADKIEIPATENIKSNTTEENFLKRSFKFESIDKLYLEPILTNNLEFRLKEINNCFKAQAYLSCILMIGSCLEGILLGLAQNNNKAFNTANSSPKTKDDKVKSYSDWNLNEFINTSFELGFIQKDVKEHSHTLRNFRNYIHPYEQVMTGFNPNKHSVEIAIQVLNASIYEIIQKNNSQI